VNNSFPCLRLNYRPLLNLAVGSLLSLSPKALGEAFFAWEKPNSHPGSGAAKNPKRNLVNESKNELIDGLKIVKSRMEPHITLKD